MAEKRVDGILQEMGSEVKECCNEITKDIKQLIWILGASLVYIQKAGLEDDFNKFIEQNETTLKKGFNL